MFSAELISLHSLLLCASVNRKIKPCVCSFAARCNVCCLHLLLTLASCCAPTHFMKCNWIVVCCCSPSLQLMAACFWNSNWETVDLHESITCLSSFYWKLNPPSPVTHPSSSYGGQSQQIFMHHSIFSKSLNYFCCLLMYLSGFTNVFSELNWGIEWCVVLWNQTLFLTKFLTVTDLSCTFIYTF